MAMSKSANNYNRQNWEEAEFPILCQTCLGDNPYIRMTKEKYGKECKTCARPFTVFRWCPGARMRFKKTEVCQTCAKMKNICQTCLLDLEYGLPVQVRDAALKIQDEMPKSDVGKEYYTQQVEKELANTDGTTPVGSLGKAQAPSDMLLKLARTTPYYKRNRPHICSFWVKGECRRGEECPYRHERPTDPDDPLSTQNIKDRFYGINDPVADKLLNRYSSMPALELPEDKTITTLYVGNLGDTVDEQDLRNNFYQYGEIRSISMVARQQCAFIQFTMRSAAEMAAEKTFNKLIVNGRRLNVKWGKSTAATGSTSQLNDTDQISAVNKQHYKPVPGLPGELPAAPDFFNLSEGSRSEPLTDDIPLPPVVEPKPPLSTSGGPPPPMRFHPHHAPPPLHMMGPPMPPPHMGGMGPRHGPPGHFRPGMRMPPPPPFPPMMRPPPMRPGMGYMPLPPRPPMMPPPRMSGGIHYPSQDPSRMGSADRTSYDSKDNE